ncbi:LOW QUALITY PROTEIN: uncharacterized protein ACR2FA_008735 [Aphomia sociella]
MKNISSIKSKNTADSPKTPGGISKSLLTPCRRVGLSRNWKRGPSPFVSPLSSKTDERPEKEPRKRKDRDKEVRNVNSTSVSDENVESNVSKDNISTTPTRNIDSPRRKRSKTILSSISNGNSNTYLGIDEKSQNVEEASEAKLEEDVVNLGSKEDETVKVTPLCRKSKSKKVLSPLKSPKLDIKVDPSLNETCGDFIIKNEVRTQENFLKASNRSPENLTKECIVVIQKKIFKKNLKKDIDVKSTSQTLFDSDSDDVPLCDLNKIIKSQNEVQPEVSNLDEDDDFEPTNKIKMPSSQSSCNDDDDDDDFETNNKRTILIRKTYEKVPKPVKAKSTGSITQKDIDELKSRIEIKKKLLLAKAMTKDTEELRDLVKKWQKGCQDALMELMELMKTKFPDRQNMEYTEMLQLLKIPASLVGYDSENDCFVTPDDSTIILSKFNNI